MQKTKNSQRVIHKVINVDSINVEHVLSAFETVTMK